MNRYYYQPDGTIVNKVNYRTGGSCFFNYPFDYFETELDLDIDSVRYDLTTNSPVDRE
jgi:ribonuclease I